LTNGKSNEKQGNHKSKRVLQTRGQDHIAYFGGNEHFAHDCRMQQR